MSLVNQSIKGVEEFLLAGFLTANEVDVVDHQHVDTSEFVLKGLRVLMTNRLDEQTHEALCRQISDLSLWTHAANVPGDGVH